MSQLSLAQQLHVNHSSAMQLARWYQVQQQQLEVSSFIPSAEQGLFTVAFSFQNEQLQLSDLVAFLAQHQLAVDYICCYQGDENLAPAWCLYSENSRQAINPLVLKEFADQHQFQLVQLTEPPSIAKPGLLLMDMDSTAITIECIDEIARLANVYDEVSAVTAEAMAGKLDFEQSLRQRVAKLEGIEQSLIDELKSQLPLMPGVKHLCQILKQYNWYLAIASGGFVPFAEQVQQLLTLDEVHANHLESVDGVLTGQVTGQIVDAEQKAVVLKQLQQKLDLNKQQTVAMGDGANDLKMMAAAGLGIAVHGKPKVVEQAQTAINHGSLLQVLHLLTLPIK